MSLFSKTEISEEIIPFIENGEGVGIVKVNGYGKASARMESYKIIFDSYEGKSPIIESVSAITYLSYKKGNFFNEPKLEIGISHKKYVLAGVENNDAELETFYKTILDIKNLEKEQKTSSYVGIKKSNAAEETKSVNPVSKEMVEEDVLDIKQESPDENIKDEDVVEQSSEEETKDSTEDLEKIIEDDEEDFEVIEALDESVEPSDKSQEEQNKQTVDDTESSDNDEIKASEEIISDDVDDDEEEFEEIFIESDEVPSDNFDEENLLSDEPIIEDFDDDFDDFDDFDDELADNEMDSDRIIKQSDETVQQDEIEEEVVVEDEISEEPEHSEDEIFEEIEPSAEEILEESESQQDNISEENEKLEAEEEVVSNTKENIINSQIQQTAPLDDTKITAENVTSEIGKMKQRLYGGINNIQNEISNNQQSASAGASMQLDPVDQIRRYHELKEDGIITEEEFELKKKQLLDL